MVPLPSVGYSDFVPAGGIPNAIRSTPTDIGVCPDIGGVPRYRIGVYPEVGGQPDSGGEYTDIGVLIVYLLLCFFACFALVVEKQKQPWLLN
jgi:hypothetical protein